MKATKIFYNRASLATKGTSIMSPFRKKRKRKEEKNNGKKEKKIEKGQEKKTHIYIY